MATPQRTAKRIYSPAAVEFWFRKLGEDWEPHFSDASLARGREIYTSGVIREIELSPEDAIIHCKIDKEAFYALVEWKQSMPVVRGSVESHEFNSAVAAAGLYEIEELVADEVSAVQPEAQSTSQSEDIAPASWGKEDSKQEFSANGSRHLEIVLSGNENGLVAEPFWKNGSESRVPALKDTGDGLDESRSGAERESLIRLTGLAHKAGFEYRSKWGDFLLRDCKKIIPFFRENYDYWKQVFAIELDSGAKQLRRGVQHIRIEGEATEAGASHAMNIRWKLKVGNLSLVGDHAQRVMRRGSGMSMVPGVGIVEMGKREAEAIEEWRSFEQDYEFGEWPRYMLFSFFTESVADLDLESELEEWLDSVEEAGSRRWKTADFLRSYQAQGVQWLASQCDLGCHVLLADEMGLGKTLQILGLFDARPLEGDTGQRPHLIVCPASVVPVWKNEVHRFFPNFKISVLKAGQDFQSVESEPGMIWLASYTQLRRHKHQLNTLQFGYVVLDEAQQIKNPEAKVSQACMQIKAAHRLALTGTPLENRHLDLWTLFRYLMPGLLGNRKRFEGRIADDVTGEFSRQLSEQLQPFILRRTKDEVMSDLPPKVEMDLACPLTDLQVKRYRQLTEDGLTALGDDLDSAVQSDSMHFFTLLTRLRQVCCDPGLLPGESCDLNNSGKIQALGGKVEEILDNGSKVVIFSQFTGFIDRIREAFYDWFPEVPIYELTGKSRDRESPVKQFQETEGGAVILVSLRAGGVGITLHAADYVFLMDPWWNPAVEAQAIDRVHRLGQDKPVFVYRMVTEGTVEERIQALKQEKKDLFQQIIGDLDGYRGIRDTYQSLTQLVALNTEDTR